MLQPQLEPAVRRARLALELRAQVREPPPQHDRLHPLRIALLGEREQGVRAGVPRGCARDRGGIAPRQCGGVFASLFRLLDQGPRFRALGARLLFSQPHFFPESQPQEVGDLGGEAIAHIEQAGLRHREAGPPEVGAARAFDQSHGDAITVPRVLHVATHQRAHPERARDAVGRDLRRAVRRDAVPGNHREA